MNKKDVVYKLCCHDKRYPMYSDIHFEGDDYIEPRKNCYCDNCFNGRDELAVKLLECMEKLGVTEI